MQCSVQEMVDFFRQQEHCDNWKDSASQTDRKGKYQGGLDEVGRDIWARFKAACPPFIYHCKDILIQHPL
jgi:hypothetical protein